MNKYYVKVECHKTIMEFYVFFLPGSEYVTKMLTKQLEMQCKTKHNSYQTYVIILYSSVYGSNSKLY